jgi:hypothetical protein
MCLRWRWLAVLCDVVPWGDSMRCGNPQHGLSSRSQLSEHVVYGASRVIADG